MSASVRLSLKAARQLATGYPATTETSRELEAAIAKAERSTATRKRLTKPKQAKRAEKRKETSAIYAAVERRAEGKCEACGSAFGPRDILATRPEMDHFLGRGRAAQSERNCWLLCGRCHWNKTRNSPSRADWLEVFAQHCSRNELGPEFLAAKRELAFVEARRDLPLGGAT